MITVGRVIKDYGNLMLTQKEKDEGARLLWETPEDGLKLIEKCINNLKASEYENVYHSKFIVLRDSIILRYYLDNKKEVI